MKISKRALAAIEIEAALRAANKALSLLGGRTRHKPKGDVLPWQFVTRQYLEGITNRLRVTQLLIAQRDVPKFKSPPHMPAEFIAEYEATREEKC